MEELFIFAGKAATGKDTALNYFKGSQYNILVSDTTRPKRPTEVDGVDYNFINNKTFIKKIKENQYLEFTKYIVGHEVWYYGTGKNAIKKDKINLGVLNPEGVLKVADSEFSKNLFVILFKVSDEVRKQRYIEREVKVRDENSTTLEARFDKRRKKDDLDFFELEEKLLRRNIKFTTVINDCSFEKLCVETEKIVNEKVMEKEI